MFKNLFALLILSATMFYGCGESPIVSVNDEFEDFADEANEQCRPVSSSSYSSHDRYYSSSGYDYYYSSNDDGWFRSSSSYYGYYSSSVAQSSSSYYNSSSSFVSQNTTASAEMTITLVYYHQLKSMDDANTSDGEPRISFTVTSYDEDDLVLATKTTSTINLGNDVGTWSGEKSVSITIPKDVNHVKVCPIFVDEDVLFNDSEYTSKKCYTINNIGSLIGVLIGMTDDGSAYYTMDWDVLFQYN